MGTRPMFARRARLFAVGLVLGPAMLGAQAPVVSPDATAAWGHLAPTLQALLLTDEENGEVLGTALDLVARVGPAAELAGPPAVDVDLSPGAADRLRRAAEFVREPEADVTYPLRYRRTEGAPVVRILLRADRRRGRIELVPHP